MAYEESNDIDWSVYVLLDPERLHPENELLETAEAALEGGAGLLQLRDKRSSGRRLVCRATKLQALADQFDTTFIVNDRLDVALASGADGVHLGPEDIPVEKARSVAPELIIGGSAGSPEEAGALQRAGVDYVGCGAVYDAGESKPDASDPRGPEAVEEVVAAVDIPVVGIGGIRPENARAVVEAGAAGVAVIRAVVGRADPESATRELVEAVG